MSVIAYVRVSSRRQNFDLQRNAISKPAATRGRRLREAALGSAHVWMAEARITFARPNELSDLERLLRLERMPVPSQTDLRKRAAHALYGADPDAAIVEKRRALAVQRERSNGARSSTRLKPKRRRRRRTGRNRKFREVRGMVRRSAVARTTSPPDIDCRECPGEGASRRAP